MADYVSREVARERLHKACKAGIILSVLILLAGLVYAGIAAIIATNTRLPEFVINILYIIVPTLSDTYLALADCATKAVLFLLIGLFGILMFRKMAKKDDAFRTGQMRQLKFIALLLVLLGFLPTLVGNIAKVVMAIQRGGSPMAVMSFDVNGMCVIAGLFMSMAARALVAGSLLGKQQEQLAADPTTVTAEPDYSDVPDMTHVTTAVDVAPPTTVLEPAVGATQAQVPTFVNDAAWDEVASEFDSLGEGK
jgi:hypothetical protein